MDIKRVDEIHFVNTLYACLFVMSKQAVSATVRWASLSGGLSTAYLALENHLRLYAMLSISLACFAGREDRGVHAFDVAEFTMTAPHELR